MLAGATAGIAEHVGMYPVDTLKTRMQALGHPGQRVGPYAQLNFCCKLTRLFFYWLCLPSVTLSTRVRTSVLLSGDSALLLQLRGSTLSKAFTSIVKREGVRGLYGGAWAVAWGAG